MKKFILIALLFMAKTYAQDTITTAKVKEYIGKEVWVKGKVAAFKPAGEGSTANYINVDQAFPNNVFTIVLTTKYMERLKLKLDNAKGKKILVKGLITLNAKEKSSIPEIFNPVVVQVK